VAAETRSSDASMRLHFGDRGLKVIARLVC
jgi:hypothetical protein